jgi:hypothetical protein
VRGPRHLCAGSICSQLCGRQYLRSAICVTRSKARSRGRIRTTPDHYLTVEGLEGSRRANWKHGYYYREAKAERSRERAPHAGRRDTRAAVSTPRPRVVAGVGERIAAAVRAMSNGSLDSQVGARICNGLGIICPFWSKWARSRRGNEDDQHR